MADRVLIQAGYWFAVIFLIAGIDQGIQRKRVVVGRSDVFFYQGAEDADFDVGEYEVQWDVRDAFYRGTGGVCRPCGTRSIWMLTPDLRPGPSYSVASRLEHGRK